MKFRIKNLTAYHMTNKKHIPFIEKNGLLPKTPGDHQWGDERGIYLFKTVEDLENAWTNWLGDRIEEWEDESGETYTERILKINLSGLEPYLESDVDYEWRCTVPIEPERIVSVIDPITVFH